MSDTLTNEPWSMKVRRLEAEIERLGRAHAVVVAAYNLAHQEVEILQSKLHEYTKAKTVAWMWLQRSPTERDEKYWAFSTSRPNHTPIGEDPQALIAKPKGERDHE